MAHPHEEHKTTHLKRVGKMLSGYAKGGSTDAKQDRKMIKKAIHAHEAMMHGGKPKARADKFARGGRAKGKTHINVNVMPQNPMQPQRIPVPVPAQTPQPPMGAGAMPPGALPGGAPRPPMPGMMPPGMPMRKSGGRVKHADGGRSYGGGPLAGEGSARGQTWMPEEEMDRQMKQYPPDKDSDKRGGRVKHRATGGRAWEEGLRHGTKVQHLPGKDNSDNLKKPYPVTRASGGRANFGEKMKTPPMAKKTSGNSEGGHKATSNFSEKMKQPPVLMHGSAGGLGRLEKLGKERKVYP